MISITSAQLKMFANICGNLVVVFIVAIPLAREVDVLIFNLLGAMMFWKLGVLTEEKLEEI